MNVSQSPTREYAREFRRVLSERLYIRVRICVGMIERVGKKGGSYDFYVYTRSDIERRKNRKADET